MSDFTHLLSPMTVNGVTFKNRIFAAPNVLIPMDFTDMDRENFISYVEAKARGGAAAVTLGDVPCDLNELISLSDEELLESEGFKLLEDLAGRINRHGAVSALELISSGVMMPEGMLAAYGFLMGPCGGVDEDGDEIVEMGPELRARVIGDYARAAQVLKMAGFRMLMIQAGHCWLINQWLSPIWNKRTDAYGGDYDGRARFPIEILDAIREKIGREMLIEYRISGSDLFEGGNEVEDVIELLKLIGNRIDIIHVSSGSVLVPGKMQTGITLFGPYGNNVHLAGAIKRALPDMAVGVVGNMINPEHLEACVAGGQTDFVCLARGEIVDPEFAKKLAGGRREEILPCQRCFNCMNDRRAETGRPYSFECAMNPYTYKNLSTNKSENPKNILVIGGGAGGMTAAVEAAKRGHRVTLLEKTGELGGIIRFSEKDSVKCDLRLYLRYIRHMLAKSGAEVHLNTEATPELVSRLRPDVIFAATGSTPVVPPIPGIAKARHVLEIFDHPEYLRPGRTVMIGGGLAGCEAAVHIANLGQAVTVVEMRDEIGADAFMQAIGGLFAAFEERGIPGLPGRTCTGIGENGVKLRTASGENEWVEAENVVYALGMKPENALAASLLRAGFNVIPVGDCKKAGKMMGAIYDATLAVIGLG